MKKNFIKNLIFTILFLLIASVVLYPVFLIIINSFKTTRDFYSNPIGLPREISLKNLMISFEKLDYINTLKNNLIILTSSLSVIVFISALAAYPLSKKRFSGRNGMYSYFLSGMVLPSFTALIPTIILIKNLHLINTYFSLIAVYAAGAMPFTIVLYTSFYKAIPFELEEAAALEGAGMFKVFLSIYFPLLKVSTITVIVLQCIGIWNDFLLPYLLLNDPSKRTLMPALYSFYSQQLGVMVKWELIFPSMLLIMAPLLIIYILAKKHFISGMMQGSVKG